MRNENDVDFIRLMCILLQVFFKTDYSIKKRVEYLPLSPFQTTKFRDKINL